MLRMSELQGELCCFSTSLCAASTCVYRRWLIPQLLWHRSMGQIRVIRACTRPTFSLGSSYSFPGMALANSERQQLWNTRSGEVNNLAFQDEHRVAVPPVIQRGLLCLCQGCMGLLCSRSLLDPFPLIWPQSLMDAYTVNEEANKESQRCPTPRPPPLGSSAPVCGTSSKQANQQAPTGNDGGVQSIRGGVRHLCHAQVVEVLQPIEEYRPTSQVQQQL
mmetsp:Transcript_10381/g.23479  ORF Transcript_10381/g.23479 Transcript_10381/m.23479 type:complete len:219 (-) Transcript_10381:72-728(-)